ncbi:MAG: acyl-CoA dehydrogenase [Vitreoscilla sp.]|nr:acyl-CoA dehydrogenase [Vitreoscilla sp.]
MPALSAQRRDLDFLLFDMLGVQGLTRAPRFVEHSRETFGAALDAAQEIAEREYAPLNALLDADEPRMVNGEVRLPAELKPALAKALAAGFNAATFDADQGGMQLPQVVAQSCWALFKGACVAADTYCSLSIGVANMLSRFGTPAQRATYLGPLLSGRCFGTMVLTEPQAGSALADVRASATPLAHGGYAIRAQKIFITAGDHGLAENIVHLVLARLPDAPAGVKGLSLFIVPKYRVEPDGSCGAANDVVLAGLIHKMGSKGTTSALLQFGAQGACVGELLGEPHQGLACMFHMMNEARINVGIAATMLAAAGYRHALAYARERVQGRASADPRSNPVPIVRHADVRRMLLAQKAIAEGGLSLCLQGALWADEQQVADSAQARDLAGALLDLMTPVIKAWCASQGRVANALAIQVLGGYGYTRDHPVEQHYRDNRLNSIHEGTDGIQALDLLGRKVGARGGEALAALGRLVASTIAQSRLSPPLAELAAALERAWGELHDTTALLVRELPRAPQLALANASLYLHVFGHTVVAWMWLRQALAAASRLESPDQAFHQAKLAATHYFFRYELPQTRPLHDLLRRLDPLLTELDDAVL